MTRADQIFAKFVNFHKANPEVYEHFERITNDLINSGFKHYGGAAILGQVRWNMTVKTVGSKFKINEIFMSYYTRMFTAKNPQHADFFRKRRRPSTKTQIAGTTQNGPMTESTILAALAVL